VRQLTIKIPGNKKEKERDRNKKTETKRKKEKERDREKKTETKRKKQLDTCKARVAQLVQYNFV
jgi:hypothetical protein